MKNYAFLLLSSIYILLVRAIIYFKTICLVAATKKVPCDTEILVMSDQSLCCLHEGSLGLQGRGGGGTLIFSYIRRLGSFFRVQNFEFQYFLGGFRKMNIF